MKRCTKTYVTLCLLLLIVIGITGCSMKMTEEEKAKEKKNMLAYLENKYNQEFKIETIEKDNLGTGGTLISGKVYDEADNLFVIDRREYEGEYKDTYIHVLVSKLLMKHYKDWVLSIADSASFYIMGNNDEFATIHTSFSDLNKKEIRPSFRIAILVDTNYKRENYYASIQQFIRKMYGEGFENLKVNIDFILEKNEQYVKDFIESRRTEIIHSEGDAHQEKRGIYEKGIIDSFKYNMLEHSFEDNEEFVKTLFKKAEK